MSGSTVALLVISDHQRRLTLIEPKLNGITLIKSNQTKILVTETGSINQFLDTSDSLLSGSVM